MNKPTKEQQLDFLRTKITTDPRWTERALLKIFEAQTASETPYGTPAELTPAGDQEQPIPGQVPPTADPSYPYPPAQPVDPSYPPTADPSYPPTAPTDAPYPSPYPSETAPAPY